VGKNEGREEQKGRTRLELTSLSVSRIEKKQSGLTTDDERNKARLKSLGLEGHAEGTSAIRKRRTRESKGSVTRWVLSAGFDLRAQAVGGRTSSPPELREERQRRGRGRFGGKVSRKYPFPRWASRG